MPPILLRPVLISSINSGHIVDTLNKRQAPVTASSSKKKAASRNWRIALSAVGIAAGIILLVQLIINTDVSHAPQILISAGWWILAAVLLPYTIAAMLDTKAWSELMPHKDSSLSFLKLFRIRTATEALVITVPMGSIISDPVKAWMLKREGHLGFSKSTASIVMRKSLLGFSQGIVALAIALIAVLFPTAIGTYEILGKSLAWTLLFGATAIVLLYALIVALTCYSKFGDWLQSWLRRLPFPKLRLWFERKEPEFQEINLQLRTLGKASFVTRATLLYILLWVIEDMETFAILALLGAHMTLPQAFLMETTCVLMRTAAFMVPGGIGVQDTGYVGMLVAAGNSGSMAAAFLVLKRSREVIWAIIGYIMLLTSKVRASDIEVPTMANALVDG
jgi:uncharacterized protein (TIRG00374 family)